MITVVRLRVILIMSGTAIALTACGGSGSSNGKESVVASFYPLAFAAEEIGRVYLELAGRSAS